MELTKEAAKHCRCIGALRDFLCQAMDQIDEKDKEIAELKAKIEDVQNTAYTDSVDAGMRERKLKRALWMARKAHAVAMFAYWDSHYRDNPNAVYRNRTICWLRNRWLLILDAIIKKKRKGVQMSELKAKHVVDVYDVYSSNPYNEAQVYLKSETDRYIKNLKRAIWIVKAERFKSGYFHFDLEKDFWSDRGETDKENHYYEKREQCARLEKICRQRAKELE